MCRPARRAKFHGVLRDCLALFPDPRCHGLSRRRTPSPCLAPARAYLPSPAQKKPRLRGVSVACLCVEECRSRCYTVSAVFPEPGARAEPALFFGYPLASSSFPAVAVDGVNKSNTRANRSVGGTRASTDVRGDAQM